MLKMFFLDLSFFRSLKNMFLQNHITKVLNCLSTDFSQHVTFFTRARFTFSPGFFHLLAANSTQIFDLLMNMTHEASSRIILKSQTQALIKLQENLKTKKKQRHPEKQTMRASPTSKGMPGFQAFQRFRHLKTTPRHLLRLQGSPALGRRRAARAPTPASATACRSQALENSIL